METLAKQELTEANTYLVEFAWAHQMYTGFTGGSLVCGAALPILILINWFLGTSSLFRGAILGLVFVVCGFVMAFWYRFRAHKAFRNIQSRCLKLQKAGYILYKKPKAFRKVLDIKQDATDPDVEAFDFEQIDPWNFYYKMI